MKIQDNIKKNYKIYIILTFILLVIGGKFAMLEIEKQKILREESPRIEKFIYYNFNDIEKVTFTKLVANPTGVVHIEGYINDDKSLDFSAGLYDKKFETAISYSPKLKKKFKTFKSVSEIEAEEKKQEKNTLPK